MARDSLSWPTLSVSDEAKAHIGCYRKGDIVEVRETGAPRGGAEGLPDFVWVTISNANKSQTIAYMDDWERVIDFNTLLANPPYYEVRISYTPTSTSGFDAITKEQVKRWLKKQDSDILGHGANYVDVAFTVPDNLTVADLKQWAIVKLRKVKRRQWCFPASEVDSIISQGGEVTMSKQEAQSIVYSKTTTVDGN
jgi:hypothetical protein